MERRDHLWLKAEGDVAIGNVLFVDSKERTVLFARANTVIFIRNLGAPFDFAGSFAQQFDKVLGSTPDSVGRKEVVQMDKFFLPDGEFHVGDEVKLETKPDRNRSGRVFYKLVSAEGEVFSREERLIYRPRISGLNEIRAFRVEADQNIAEQILTLHVI
jgi:hypothetical protein